MHIIAHNTRVIELWGTLFIKKNALWQTDLWIYLNIDGRIWNLFQ